MRGSTPLPREKSRSLASQLIIVTFAILVLVFAASLLVTRHFVGQVMLEHARNDLGFLAHNKIHQIEIDMRKLEIQGKMLKELLALGTLDERELLSFIDNQFIENNQLRSVCIAQDPVVGKPPVLYQLLAGKTISKRMDGTDYQFMDWYQIPDLTNWEYWSEPWYDTYATGRILVSYSLPIQMAGNRGILRLDMPLESFQTVAQQVKIYKTGYAILLTNNGTIVTHPADSLLMNYTFFDLAEELGDPTLRDLGRKMCSGRTGFLQIPEQNKHPSSWYYYIPLQTNQWTLAIVVPEKELLADLKKLLWMLFFSELGAFTVICGGIYVSSLRLNHTLKPIVESFTRIGSGDFQTPLPELPHIRESEVLGEAVTAMQNALQKYVENIRLVTDEKNKILNEVIFASAIQRNLIPKNTGQPLSPDRISSFGILEPAGEIGGDLYDYFLLDQDTYCFAIADVAGKGIVAAMTMTMVTTLLRSIAPGQNQPELILKKVNTFLIENNLESNFVTIILGIIDLTTGRMTFANAGHVPLYIVNPARKLRKYSETHSTALGFLKNLKIGSEKVSLEPGDTIVVLTDGVTEAMSSNNDFFGYERLEAVLNSLSQTHPEITANAILTEVHAFSNQATHKDDISILAIEYLGNGTL
jgi:sigma-B regulation protein RsbU (phosphoserine phosphatase)